VRRPALLPPIPHRATTLVGFFVLAAMAGAWMVVAARIAHSPRAPFGRTFPLAGASKPAANSPLLFLGDSITAAGPWVEAFPGRTVVNAGIPGNTTRDLLERLDALPIRRHSTVVLMAGINDILRGEQPAPVAERMLEVRHRLLKRGAARVLVVATLPCDAARMGPRCLAPVLELNRRTRLGVPVADWLDLTPRFSDGTGLRPALAVDGLHLSPAGYWLWLKQLRPML